MGTRSQIVRYSDETETILVYIHRYLRPDGTLGASGKSDPVMMRVGDELWKAIPEGT